MIAVGYVRVSTHDQAENGYGLAAQETAIRHAAEHRGWTLAEVYRDEGLSGKTLERPSLTQALEQIAHREAGALIVSKLDRLSRSVSDFAILLEWFDRAGAAVVALDMDVDTSSANGELMAHIFAAFAQWERRIISQRTKDGLAEARRQGRPTGRPGVADDPVLAQQIRDWRDCQLSYRQICEELMAMGVPTSRGGLVWRPSALQAVLGPGRRPSRRPRVQLPEIERR